MSGAAASFERVARDALYGLTFRPASIKSISQRSGPWAVAVLLAVACAVPSTALGTGAGSLGRAGVLVLVSLFIATFLACMYLWSASNHEGLQRSYATASMAGWIMLLNAVLLTVGAGVMPHIDIVTTAWFFCAWAYYMIYRTRAEG